MVSEKTDAVLPVNNKNDTTLESDTNGLTPFDIIISEEQTSSDLFARMASGILTKRASDFKASLNTDHVLVKSVSTGELKSIKIDTRVAVHSNLSPENINVKDGRIVSKKRPSVQISHVHKAGE